MADNKPDTGKQHDELSRALSAANEQHIIDYNKGHPMKAAVAALEYRTLGQGSSASVIISSVSCPPEGDININDELLKSAAAASNFSNMVEKANLKLPLASVKYDWAAPKNDIIAHCGANYKKADSMKKGNDR